MAGAFDDQEIEQVAPRHDTELTLGTTALLLIFFGLLALCGLCFGMGYSMGRHGSPETSASPPSAANEKAFRKSRSWRFGAFKPNHQSAATQFVKHELAEFGCCRRWFLGQVCSVGPADLNKTRIRSCGKPGAGRSSVLDSAAGITR
jgi:hypothetical protein